MGEQALSLRDPRLLLGDAGGVNHDLGLRFRWSLSAGEPYGLIRECRLENIGDIPVTVRYLDGFHQLIAKGGMRVDPNPRADDPDNTVTEAPKVTRE